MLTKNKRPYDAADFSPTARLRKNLQDIMGDNLSSQRRIQELHTDIGNGAPLREYRSRYARLIQAITLGPPWPTDHILDVLPILATTIDLQMLRRSTRFVPLTVPTLAHTKWGSPFEFCLSGFKGLGAPFWN